MFFAKKFEKHAQVQPIEIVQFSESEIVPITEDGFCVFLDREKHSCAVYENRPGLCRKYGRSDDLPCPYIKKNGNPRSPAQVKRIQRKINHDVHRFSQSIEGKP